MCINVLKYQCLPLKRLYIVFTTGLIFIFTPFLHGKNASEAPGTVNPQKEFYAFSSSDYSDSASYNRLWNFIKNGYRTRNLQPVIDTVNIILEKNGSLSEKQHQALLEELANLWFEKGNPEQALKTLKEYLRWIEKSNDSTQIARTYGNVAMLNRMLGNYRESLKNLIKAREIAEKLPDKVRIPLLMNIYQLLGNLHRSLKTYDQSITYHKKALEMASLAGDSMRIAMIYNDMGSSYIESGDTLNAKTKYSEAIKLNERFGNVRMLEHNYSNLANILSAQGDNRKALEYYLKALKITEQMRDSMQLDNLYNNISINYGKLGDKKKALKYANKAIETAKKTGSKLYLYDIMLNLAEQYAGNGDFANAYNYLKESYIMKDSLLNEQNMKTINELREKYEAGDKARKIELLKAEKEATKLKNKLLVTYLISAVTVIVSLVLLLLFIIDKRKKEKKLMEKELEKERLIEKHLQRELAIKSRQLTSHSLNMMQKNEFLRRLLLNLKEVSEKDDNTVVLKQLSREVEHTLKAEKDWELFKKYFEEVEAGFFDKMKLMNPDLTSNDLRLCALLKLNMTTKEISSMLNVTPQSVKVAKNRLRKKMKVEAGADLCKIMEKITAN